MNVIVTLAVLAVLLLAMVTLSLILLRGAIAAGLVVSTVNLLRWSGISMGTLALRMCW